VNLRIKLQAFYPDNWRRLSLMYSTLELPALVFYIDYRLATIWPVGYFPFKMLRLLFLLQVAGRKNTITSFTVKDRLCGQRYSSL
jgi:hypothetical protein